MSERGVDYKTAAYELQSIVKNLSNEASFRSFAAQEPLILKHYEAGKVIDQRARDIVKKTGVKYSDRFVSLAGWKLRLLQSTSAMRLNRSLMSRCMAHQRFDEDPSENSGCGIWVVDCVLLVGTPSKPYLKCTPLPKRTLRLESVQDKAV